MDEYSIQFYFNLKGEIKRLERLKRQVGKSIYHQTLSTHIAYSNEKGVHVEAPRIEKLVIDSVLACELINTRIERHYSRLKYFTTYLSTLDIKAINCLRDGRYSEELREQTLDEIREIETAICYHAGIEAPEEKFCLSEDVWSDLDNLLEVLN